MAINFPDSPATNDSFTSGGKKWIFNGTVWSLITANSYTIPTGEVTTAKILDANVTAAKLASGAAVSNIGYTPANIAGPTFTGTVVLPSTTSIGTVSSTEIGYVDGVTSAIQTQLDSKLTATTAITSGRNRIINGDFRINQRAFTSTTTNGTYGFDRWRIDANGGTTTYSAQTFSIGNAISGQEPTNHARVVTSGQTNTNGVYSLFRQPIEDVRTYAGQQVTISFWAKSGSGTPKVAIEFEQNFGSGGSSGITQYAGQATLSTSWQRFTLTTTIPSISGKTIGTSSHLLCTFILSGGPDWSARSGSIGIQSNTFDIWGVQLEAGAVATPFEFEDIGTTLAKCQRYFNRAIDFSADNGGTATQQAIMVGQNFSSTGGYGAFVYPRMRISPVVTFSGQADFIAAGAGGNNIATTAIVANAIKPTSCELRYTVASGLTAGQASFVYTTGSSGKIDLSAEL